MTSVFISYSHADEELRRQLDLHLSALKRQGLIDVWHDRRITAGEVIDAAIDEHLAAADVILLLVSPDFIASNYCYEIELATALRRHEAGEAVVIPVILRACDWHDLRFGKLRATPTDGKPVRLFPDIDSAFLEVVRDLKAALSRLRGGPKAPSRTVGPAVVTQERQVLPNPRSGNLGIRQHFTDFDRDQFRVSSFEYIARYFENSLAELGQRNPGVRSDFRRIDATAFEAAVYDAAGRHQSRCGIWMNTGSGFGGDIAYNASGAANRNALNESLSIDDDGAMLGLRSLGMFAGSGGTSEKHLLTQEGAAEHLWSAFIEPLQR